MRPSILNPLFAAAASLTGIGPKNAKLLDRFAAIPRDRDTSLQRAALIA